MKKLDLTGMRFTRLLVISQARTNKFGHVTWNCRCDCGGSCIVEAMKLRSAHTRSCGCIKREHQTFGQLRHGYAQGGVSTEYQSWCSAKSRCENPSSPDWDNYGGRGIRMSKSWSDDFASFIAHMGPRPPGATLERKDVNGHYEAGNCKWASVLEQAFNRRTTIRVTLTDGQQVSLRHFARLEGVHYLHLYNRVRFGGMTPHEASKMLQANPRPPRADAVLFNGRTVKQIARERDMNYYTLRVALQRGENPETFVPRRR